MTFFTGRGFAELQILKKWKWPYLLNWWNIVMKFCIHIDIDTVKPHLGLVEVQILKQWNLTLKPFGKFW